VIVRAAPESEFFGLDVLDPQGDVTAMGWEVYPAALYDVLRRVARDYTSIPIMITENGAAYDDRRNGAEVVEDPARVAYISRHIAEIERAVADGVPVAGYFAWSLLDNFEWEHGYSKRFGLVYVDYATQERIPKESAIWYRDHIARARNGG
jgi:beta-glucosidase